MTRRLLAVLTASLLAIGMSLSTTVPSQASPRPTASTKAPRPVVFVHGASGSADQFDAQARRLTSNGYPATWVEGHEYDSTMATNTMEMIFAALDQRIAKLLAATGKDKVDLLGHSMGTMLMQIYLRSAPERAARIAHYVNLDGAASADLPGGVPTLAVWGEGSTSRTIVGATNVSLPEQSHTETVTSPETFKAFYKFFTGAEPRTTEIVAERGPIQLSGRAIIFPSNVGVDTGTLEVYPVRASTGARLSKRPAATFKLTGDGSWGPFTGRGNQAYEFAIVRSGAATHHHYFQPFLRTNRMVRLLTSKPGQGISALTETSPAHTNLVITRYKEMRGDQGAGNDSVTVAGKEILNAANSPRARNINAIIAYDKGKDRATDLATPIATIASQRHLTGIDLFVAASTPTKPVRIVATPRGGGGHRDVIVVPNWPSSEHSVSVRFNDFTPATGRR